VLLKQGGVSTHGRGHFGDHRNGYHEHSEAGVVGVLGRRDTQYHSHSSAFNMLFLRASQVFSTRLIYASGTCHGGNRASLPSAIEAF
jgi:hypothetical protein